MPITPADIEKKTFSTALRGYDLDEVDDFLDEMVVAVRELEEELARARERVAQLEGDPEAMAAAAAAAGPHPDQTSRQWDAPSSPPRRQLTDCSRTLEPRRTRSWAARSEADAFAKERDPKRRRSTPRWPR